MSLMGKGALICLVHGTFARDAPWTQAESPLCRALMDRLPGATLLPFSWSGGNSHQIRAETGQALASIIEEKLLAGDVDRVFLIGHSHGGNVALRSLDSEAVEAAVRGMIFLGTPFLIVDKRNWDRTIPAYAKATATLAAFIVSLIGIALLATIAFTVMEDFTGKIVFLIGMLALTQVFEGIYDFVLDRLKWDLPDGFDLAADHAEELISTTIPPCPSFIAAVAADEAGFLLAGVDRVTHTPIELLRLVGEAFLSIIAGVLAGVMVLQFAQGGIIEDSAALGVLLVVFVIVSLGFVFLPLPFAILFSLVRSSPVAFGGESPLMVLAARVRPSAAPPWSDAPGSVRRIWPRADVAGLRHSFFYSSPEVINAAATWVAQVDTARQGPRISARYSAVDAPLLKHPIVRWVPGSVVAILVIFLGMAEF